MAAHAAGSAIAALGFAVALATLGAWLPRIPDAPALALLGVTALAVTLRDLGVIRIPVSFVLRQTSKTWPDRFGPTVGPFLWGLDLGSGATTVVVYGGYWLLVIAAFLHASTSYAVLLFAGFTMGRLASLASAVPVVSRGATLADAVSPILVDRGVLGWAHVLGVSGFGIGLFLRIALAGFVT